MKNLFNIYFSTAYRFTFILSFIAVSLSVSASENELTLQERNQLYKNELIFNESNEILRYASSHLHQHQYYYGSSGDLFQQFVQFLFPLTGRENRIAFMPFSSWGPKKPQYRKFKWKKYESKHFVFYYDEKAKESFKKAHAFLEDDYERNNEIFSVRNKFLKKIPIIIYQSRKDFEQTNIVSGPIPEGLGGVTEIFSWKRAVFPFEAEMSAFEHVTKHEGTHIYQIAKGAKNLPLWFIEGSAETNSIYWDADAEQFIRDAYLNDLFFDINDLWQVRGSWLMYKIGNYICNFIREKYGERALQKIYQNSVALNFNDNIKKSLGISVKELNRMVQASLTLRYGMLYKKVDPYEKVLRVQKKSVVLSSHNNFFISGRSSGPRNTLYVNRIDTKSNVIKQKVVSDKKINNESLNYFRKGADLNELSIVFAIKNGSHDEIRFLDYKYDDKDKKFILKKPLIKRFKNIRSIFSPVIVGARKIAFVGIENGLSNIYSYNFKTKRIKAITTDSAHYSNLDYSEARDTLIYSKELQRLPDRIYYNRDIFEYDFKSQNTVALTSTPSIRENHPRYSVSGTNIIFSSDEDATHNLYLYNTLTKAKQKLSNHPSGIKTAVWSGDDSLLINVNKRFVTDIVHLPLPKAFEMLNNELNLDSSKVISVKSNGQNYVYQPSHLKLSDKKAIEVNLKGSNKIIYEKNIAYVFYNNQKYKVLKIAPFEKELFIQATDANDAKKRIQSLEDKTYYFKVSSNNLISVYNPTITKDSSSKETNKKIQSILKNKIIISSWYFKNTNSALVQVNEKLSRNRNRSEYNNKATSNLYACDLKKMACKLLSGSKLSGFKKEIYWVAQLHNGSYLWTLSENKNGPYEVFLFDSKANKAKKISNNVLRFKVSQSKTSFSLLVGSVFLVYDLNKKGEWTTKQHKPSGNIIGYDFLYQSDAFMVLSSHKKYLMAYKISQGKVVVEKIPHTIKSIVYSSIEKKSGNFVIYAKPQSKKESSEKLFYWDSNAKDFYDISIRGKLKTFQYATFIDDFLVFSGKNFSYQTNETWVWKSRERKQLKSFLNTKKIKESSEWVSNLDNHLYLFSFDKNEFRKIANSIYGYDVSQNTIVYASTNNEKYNIYKYDLYSSKNSLLVESENHLFNPKILENKVYYQSYDGDHIKVNQYNSDETASKTVFSMKNHHVLLDDSNEEKSSIKFNLIPYNKPKYLGPKLEAPKIFPIEGSSTNAKDIYKLQSLLAAAAYDGRSFRILLNSYIDNIFSDKGAFINVLLLGDNRFAVFGISNLRNATSYSVFYNDRDNIQNFGINFSKRYNFDRYRALNFLTEFERQVYGTATANTLSYVDASIENNSFNVVKASTTYDHDVTIWDRHGPISGSRVFFRLSAGADLSEQRLAYYSANTDLRYYNSILPKFSLAHRLVAGTSQGPLPEIFLAGGNVLFRGVNFDDLQGQNYAIFSEDIRLPLFDFIGAKFFDPVDRFFGFLTKFFDVRTGAFIDVGDVWYNDEDFELMYASGFFANVPSLLGVNLRFHYSVWGEQGFGFWIGSNW